MIYQFSTRGTMSGTTPFLAIVPSASRSFQIIEIDLQGMGNASGANEAGLYQIAAAGTGAGTTVATGVSAQESPNMTGTTPALAFSGSVFSTYASTQPTLGLLKHNMPFNSNGQRYFWKANTNLNNAIVVPGNTLGLCVAPLSGTAAYVLRIQLSEL